MTFTGRNASQRYLEWIVADAQFTVDQALQEGEALRGSFGPQRQIAAMAECYARLKAAGRMDEAQAVKAEAYAIRNAQGETR